MQVVSVTTRSSSVYCRKRGHQYTRITMRNACGSTPYPAVPGSLPRVGDSAFPMRKGLNLDVALTYALPLR